MQAVVDGIPNHLVSQSGTRAVGPPFCLQIIVIGTEFALYSVGQEVCSQSRGISGQRSIHCRPVCLHTILHSTIRSGLNFAKSRHYRKYWLIKKKTLALWHVGTRVCRHHETKRRSHDQHGQRDLQVRCDSQLVHRVFHGKCTKVGKIVGLIVAIRYSAVGFIFCIYYNIFHQLSLIYIIAHNAILY